MVPQPKALLLLLTTSLEALAPLAPTAAGPAPVVDPERTRWVAEHAVTARSIDPLDEDFADLVPLIRVIGAARVVELGEVTHGDGATFLAKARLIRFLHQVMGFDVLAWESGIADVRWMDEALRAGRPAAEAAGRALYLVWNTREVLPTLDYVRTSQGTARPIKTVGFDCRISRPKVRSELFPNMVFNFFDRLDPALISRREREDLVAMAVGLVPSEYYAKPGLRRYNRKLPERLIATIDRRRGELLAHYPPHEIDYLRQSLVSLINMDRALGPGDRQPSPGGYTRDGAMAENLLWWLRGPLKDRKVVVWAHNYHVMNDPASDEPAPAGRPVKGGPLLGGPMSRFLKAELGPDLYSIGFASYAGTSRDLEAPAKEVPVVPGALETLLHSVGRPLLFLDFSGLPADHWLRTPWTAGLSFYEPTSAVWTRCYDGLFFIDVQKPSTPLLEN
ncbi:MAG: erythromycin esterase family protein [Acidobacteriota bacterium]|nr:erythromycin esterase family protein [Acidobacteriota bacterium]